MVYDLLLLLGTEIMLDVERINRRRVFVVRLRLVLSVVLLAVVVADVSVRSIMSLALIDCAFEFVVVVRLYFRLHQFFDIPSKSRLLGSHFRPIETFGNVALLPCLHYLSVEFGGIFSHERMFEELVPGHAFL